MNDEEEYKRSHPEHVSPADFVGMMAVSIVLTLLFALVGFIIKAITK